MHRKKISLFCFCLMTYLLCAGSASAQIIRNHIHLVGSSTVYPFALMVNMDWQKQTDHGLSAIESTGTFQGAEYFCLGVGGGHPDILMASHILSEEMLATCDKNSVTDLRSYRFGYDGIALIQSKQAYPFDFTDEELYLALTKKVWREGELVPNPHKYWNEIRSSFPNQPIRVIGPSETSGTQKSFMELALERGAIRYSADMPKAVQQKITQNVALREDGAYLEGGEFDSLIIYKLLNDPQAIGILGYSYFVQNDALVQAIPVNGIAPTSQTISDRTYPLARSLYLYVKRAHLHEIKPLSSYLSLFFSEAEIGENGLLKEQGLIPLSKEERVVLRQQFKKDMEISP